MSLTIFVGEQPIEPLIITVTGRDLTGLDVAVTGDELPDCLVTVPAPATGRVQIDFLAPFTAAGVLTVQLSLTDDDGEVDLTSPVEITVLDPTETDTSIITPTQAEGWTGVAVSVGDVARAQMMVELVVGANLTDTDFLATVSAADLRWLQLAVAHQAAAGRSPAASLSAAVSSIPGATSLTTGNVSVTLGTGSSSASSASVVGLVPMARMALARVSWRRSRTLHATPFLGAGSNPSGSRRPDWDYSTHAPDSTVWTHIGWAHL